MFLIFFSNKERVADDYSYSLGAIDDVGEKKEMHSLIVL
jgi:hypothetical protein